MDFFSHQDRARSSTQKLVFLFIVAVISLIVITSFLVIGILFYTDSQAENIGLNQALLSSDIFLTVSLVVITVIALGALYRLIQLRGGGRTVAEGMGGRLLNVNTRDADERKILNVVEEMAIASGVPVPPVYLIEDPAINAFAAGYQKEDAVIGITRGSIEQLSREELQGVIAHEFSHIFNGDMRLNIRLIGLLYGIMVLGLIGTFVLRGGVYHSVGYRSRGRRSGGIMMLGLGLMVIGYAGTFFGNMIKAAVSRQREFLADASAVQYTRNPGGISGALKKIGGYEPGSRISSTDASEISHMLFLEGVRTGLTGLFATHPPLTERIKKIEPGWQGDFSETSPSPAGTVSGEQAAGFTGEPARTPAVESVGNPTSEHLSLAASRVAGIPESLREEAHGSFGASMLMYALLIELSEPAEAEKQLDILRDNLRPEHFRNLLQIRDKAKDLSREQFLPLVDISLPSLKELSSSQYYTFMNLLSQLIVADEKISVFEWCIFKILRYNLDDTRRNFDRLIDLESTRDSCQILLSVLAAAGHETASKAGAAFDEAARSLELRSPLTYKAQHRNDTVALETAVDRLKKIKPLQKPRLLKAMVKCINADGRVTASESELLRAVGTLLDCPIPPLLAGQRFI